jgi:hypothetical protein
MLKVSGESEGTIEGKGEHAELFCEGTAAVQLRVKIRLHLGAMGFFTAQRRGCSRLPQKGKGEPQCGRSHYPQGEPLPGRIRSGQVGLQRY